jgi:FkbM family methyltransferase
MKRYGTGYGGWPLPTDAALGPQSVIYSAGVGEDMSFDILVQDTFKAQIVLIDPTPRAIQHYREVQDYYKTKIPTFTGSIQPEYVETIEAARPDFSAFTYVEKALWDCSGTLQFYKQKNPKYVSQTLIQGLFGWDAIQVPTVPLKTIMEELGHKRLDVLKLDIEGAELKVLEQMLNDRIYPTYLCVEFDLKLKGGDKSRETEALIQRLLELSYEIRSNEGWNMVFERVRVKQD